MTTVESDSVGYGRMKMAKRAALLDLERLASEMARLATKDGDDYDRFSERIRKNLEAITGKSVQRDRFAGKR